MTYEELEEMVVEDMLSSERVIELMDYYEEGFDVHTRNAAIIFGKSEDEVTMKERKVAKSIYYKAAFRHQKLDEKVVFKLGD